MALTPRMMNFCDEYLKNGGKAAEAYIATYNWSGKDAGAQVEASRLLARDDIQAYIMKLRKPVEKAVKRKIINEREYKKKLIQDRIDECIERGDDAAIARYLEIWNKMDGEYVNINKDITDHDAMVRDLDTTTLLQLVNAE